MFIIVAGAKISFAVTLNEQSLEASSKKRKFFILRRS